MPMVRQTCVYKPRLPKYMSRSQSVLVPYQLSASSYATEGDKGQRQKLGQMDRERTGTKTGTEGRGRRQMVIGTEGQGQRDMRARDILYVMSQSICPSVPVLVPLSLFLSLYIFPSVPVPVLLPLSRPCPCLSVLSLSPCSCLCT